MTDEICIGKTLAERKYIVGVPSPVCGSLYGGAPRMRLWWAGDVRRDG